jgi:hypothetical protein
MASTFSSHRLHHFLPRSGTQLAKLQEDLETQLKAATVEGDETEEDENTEKGAEDILDVGDDAQAVADENSDKDDGEDKSTEEEEVDSMEGVDIMKNPIKELEGSMTR